MSCKVGLGEEEVMAQNDDIDGTQDENQIQSLPFINAICKKIENL